MPRQFCGAAVFSSMIVVAIGCGAATEAVQEIRSREYADLLTLFKEFREFQPPKVVDGVPDYTPAGIEAQKRGLEQYRRRLEAIDPSGWPVAERVDYLLVRGEMNGLDFDLHVVRPWARDPGLYVTTPVVGFMPMMHDILRIPRKWTSASELGPIVLPLPADRLSHFRTKLEAVPKIFGQAKDNLTEVAGDLARLAIRAKEKESAIYQDLAAQLAGHHPELVPLAVRAAAAVDEFRAWLQQNESRWRVPAGIGVDNYNWYLKYVHIFPYRWEQILTIGNREYERTVAFLKLEENRNRAIPMIEPATTEAEYRRRHEEAQRDILAFIRNQGIFTVPDYLVSEEPRPFNRPGGQRSFFQQASDRDPRPIAAAHSFAGHRLDSMMRERDTRPIRAARRLYFMSGIRADGWAFYLEEMLAQAGWYDKRPKTREINYIAQAKRAARVEPELRMHSNEYTFRDAFQRLVRESPYWMGDDDAVAWYDLELYLRQPGYGMGYYLGKVQIEELLTQRVRGLGQKFNLRGFHDEFLAAGQIPISLIRWEMTGLDDQVAHMWEPHAAPGNRSRRATRTTSP